MKRWAAPLLIVTALCARPDGAAARQNAAEASAGAGARIVSCLAVRVGWDGLALLGEPYATYSVTITGTPESRLASGSPVVVTLGAGPGGGTETSIASSMARTGAFEVIVACN